jgi:restriction endonuclease Mrr
MGELKGMKELFAGRHFDREIIVLCVRWYLFQCKRYSDGNMVGPSEVRDFYGAVMADRAVKGIFITTSDFTNQAREFGTQSGLELVNMSKLIQLLEEHGLMKYDLTSGPEANNAD